MRIEKLKQRASDEFNNLSYKDRHERSPMDTVTMINQLEREKARLKRSYVRNLKEINDHIKSLGEYLMKYYQNSKG